MWEEVGFMGTVGYRDFQVASFCAWKEFNENAFTFSTVFLKGESFGHSYPKEII